MTEDITDEQERMVEKYVHVICPSGFRFPGLRDLRHHAEGVGTVYARV